MVAESDMLLIASNSFNWLSRYFFARNTFAHLFLTTTRSAIPNFIFTIQIAIQLIMIMLTFLSNLGRTKHFLNFLEFVCKPHIVHMLLSFLFRVSSFTSDMFITPIFCILMVIHSIVSHVHIPMDFAQLVGLFAFLLCGNAPGSLIVCVFFFLSCPYLHLSRASYIHCSWLCYCSFLIFLRSFSLFSRTGLKCRWYF